MLNLACQWVEGVYTNMQHGRETGRQTGSKDMRTRTCAISAVPVFPCLLTVQEGGPMVYPDKLE